MQQTGNENTQTFQAKGFFLTITKLSELIYQEICNRWRGQLKSDLGT